MENVQPINLTLGVGDDLGPSVLQGIFTHCIVAVTLAILAGWFHLDVHQPQPSNRSLRLLVHNKRAARRMQSNVKQSVVYRLARSFTILHMWLSDLYTADKHMPFAILSILFRPWFKGAVAVAVASLWTMLLTLVLRLFYVRWII